MDNQKILADVVIAVVVSVVIASMITSLTPPEHTQDAGRENIVAFEENELSIELTRTPAKAVVRDKADSVIASIVVDLVLGTRFKQLNEHCLVVIHTAPSNNTLIKHVVTSGHWYGGPQFYTARSPASLEDINFQPYLSDDLLARPTRFGSILERYWLSTSGLALYFTSDDDGLHYGVEDGNVALGSAGTLQYLICKAGKTLKDTHLYMMKTHLMKPPRFPDTSIMQYPIWSTWVRYKTQINTSAIISFAQEIKEHGFKASQIEIDDTYTTNYGDMKFDLNRFPEPEQMLQQLKDMGYTITSWVHPFVNVDSEAFQEGVENGYLVKDKRRDVAGLIKWWQGTAAMIDVFNEQAVEWFHRKLNKLQSLGIDSFKFDGGESVYMPASMYHNPNLLTQRYVQMAAKFGGRAETRAAYRNQDSGIYIRMMDKHSYWGFDNGLQSMIPSALHMSVIGYHFVLPDMIGGNAMVDDDELFDKVSVLPEKELYIRWFQLVTFLQSMQISICPWQYDEQTTQIALALTKLRETYIAPLIISLAEQAVKDGTPIVRPLWWHSPSDPVTHLIEDQFLLGDKVLVAPVVTKGVTARRVYLPEGRWLDMTNKQHYYTGPMWLNYPVDIATVPYFELRNSGK